LAVRAALRRLVVVLVLLLAVAPALSLVVATVGEPATQPLCTRAFVRATRDTLLLGAGVWLLSVSVGLPAGLLSALYRFRGREPLLLLQALPLLLPSFLPCIGWSNLAASGLFSRFPVWDAWLGCVWVLGLQAVPLPLFAAWAACQNLTASQVDAARLHGGERLVVALAARAAAPAAVLAGLLAGVLSLSDPGAPLILSCRSVAVEIRTSFAALFDYGLASRQCLALAALVLVLTAPVLVFGLRRLSAAVLARQTRAVRPRSHPLLGRLTAALLLVLLLANVVLPSLGLCLPVVRAPEYFPRALQKVAETAAPTAVFTGGAGLVAVVLATGLAWAVRNDGPLRAFVLGTLLAAFALPSALGAIGVVRLATYAPPEWDWLTRSQLTVALVLGLRFLPVATVALLRGVGSLSPSWLEVGRVHGVGSGRLFVRVVLPLLTPALAVGFLLVAVLSAADVTTTHLLQPPGTQSLTVAIFTVMANSPEGLVASLCLLNLLVVVALLVLLSQVGRLGGRRLS